MQENESGGHNPAANIPWVPGPWSRLGRTGPGSTRFPAQRWGNRGPGQAGSALGPRGVTEGACRWLLSGSGPCSGAEHLLCARPHLGSWASSGSHPGHLSTGSASELPAVGVTGRVGGSSSRREGLPASWVFAQQRRKCCWAGGQVGRPLFPSRDQGRGHTVRHHWARAWGIRTGRGLGLSQCAGGLCAPKGCASGSSQVPGR